MTTPLLTTKLYIPPVRPNLVSRPRLIERLNEGSRLGRKLTLISAPAGFGKTTLVSEWGTACERPAAWLSLDEIAGLPLPPQMHLVIASRIEPTSLPASVTGLCSGSSGLLCLFHLFDVSWQGR